MLRILAISISFMLLMVSCKKTIENPPTVVNNDTTIVLGDRQVRFSLPDGSASDTMYFLTNQQLNLYKFNIDYYAGVDSVFYDFFASGQGGNNGTIELFDFTDGIPIAGSLIKVVTNATDISYFQSGNLKAAFPHKEITLGLRLKGSALGSFFSAVYTKLYLYRE